MFGIVSNSLSFARDNVFYDDLYKISYSHKKLRSFPIHMSYISDYVDGVVRIC